MLGTKEQRISGMQRQAQELIEQAYERGYKAGQEADKDKYIEQGRNEAWEAARKIYSSMAEGGLSGDEIFSIFGDYNCIVNDYSASEAIEKIKAYEAQKQEEQKKILKPCPFCGSTDVHSYISNDAIFIDGYKVGCYECGCETDDFPKEEQAIEAWNKRAGDAE